MTFLTDPVPTKHSTVPFILLLITFSIADDLSLRKSLLSQNTNWNPDNFTEFVKPSFPCTEWPHDLLEIWGTDTLVFLSVSESANWFWFLAFGLFWHRLTYSWLSRACRQSSCCQLYVQVQTVNCRHEVLLLDPAAVVTTSSLRRFQMERTV